MKLSGDELICVFEKGIELKDQVFSQDVDEDSEFFAPNCKGFFFNDCSNGSIEVVRRTLIEVDYGDEDRPYLDSDGNWFGYFIPQSIFDGIVKSNKTTNTNNREAKMTNTNDMISSMMMMKLVDGKSDSIDLGKLVLMQSLSKGEPIKISDVVKSKLISTLKLDGDDLPLEKVMLLQMLDNNQLDVNQLVMFKMLGSMFDEKK